MLFKFVEAHGLYVYVPGVAIHESHIVLQGDLPRWLNVLGGEERRGQIIIRTTTSTLRLGVWSIAWRRDSAVSTYRFCCLS